MFKAARWRSDKNRVKAVFKLQFQASQVPQPGWDTIVVSLVPLESGKPTARSEKAAVIKGSCYWENPVYETVKFVRDPKIGRINEKIYHFLVSATGSPKVGLLGEATIDFADYAEAIKPSSVSFPLKASNSSAMLHITIQRMQDDVDGRGTEENGDAMVKPQRRTLQIQLSNSDMEGNNKDPNGTSKNNSTDDNSSINGEVRMKFPSDRDNVVHADSNGHLKKSSSSDTISPFASDSSSGLYSPRENELKNNIHQDSASILSPLSNSNTLRRPTTNAADLVTDYGDHWRSNTESSISSAPDGSIDGSTNSSEETGLREGQASDVSLDKLKNDVVVLARQVEVAELELQALRKQVVKERRQGEELLKDMCILKEERGALKRECEQLKALQNKDGEENAITGSQLDGEDLRSMLKEMKQELNHEKNLNANLHLQLQKTQEANSELILAVKDLDEMLEQKNREMSCINCNKMADRPVTNGGPQGKKSGNVFSNLQHFESNGLCETISEHEDEEQYALEVLVKERDEVKEAYSLEQKIVDLNSELEIYKKDREELETQMEQLALDYEILKQENHDISSKLEQTQLREQLRMQYECSAHLSIITDLEAHVESLEKELEKQEEAFENDLASLTCAKIEQEQRAIQLEEALRKTRWKNVNTAEQLQEELKRLSVQMFSTFNENEKLAMRALTEASELRLQNTQLEELLEKANEELGSVQKHCRVKLQELSSEKDLRKKQTDELLLKLKDKSEELENQKRSNEARHKDLLEEVLKLKVEMKQLEREKSDAYEQQIKRKHDLQAQVNHLKTAIKEYELLLHERTAGREKLQGEFSSAREEAKKLLEELNKLRNLAGEQESTIRALNSELTDLRTQYNELKCSLFENELEKEHLRKEVFHLRGNLQKKDDAITSIEKRLRDNSARAATSDGAAKGKSNRSGLTSQGSEEVANLHERIKLLEAEIKLKDASLEGSRDTFLRKEKELSNRIEELEKGIGELSQNNSGFNEEKLHKDNAAMSEIKGNAHLKDAGDAKESTNSFHTDDEERRVLLPRPEMGDMCDLNGTDKEELISGNIGSSSKLEQEVLTGYPCNQGILAEVLNEVAVLRERNESMEAELKEMQERYSEISLKFAEVEGERQQLVMTIRTLKNAMKN